MENSSLDYRKKLYSQIQEEYGKLVYTYTCHFKMADRLSKRNFWIKWGQIGLSAISTGGFLGVLISNKQILLWAGGLCSTALLALTSYLKDKDISTEKTDHINVAYLEYSNNPHVDTEKGKTPEKKVYDWTFKMGINKVNENGGQLTGAKFALSKNGTLKVADMNCNDEGIPAVTTGLIAMVKISDGEYRVAVDGDTNVVYVVDAGNPVIKGLDDAVDYYLYETKAPAGYNLLSEPVHFKISAAYNEDGSNYTDVTVTVGAAAASNTLSANVVNKSGSTLPETGGIGTTIFYVLGSLLVVGAGVVLITRKRMGKSEN